MNARRFTGAAAANSGRSLRSACRDPAPTCSAHFYRNRGTAFLPRHSWPPDRSGPCGPCSPPTSIISPTGERTCRGSPTKQSAIAHPSMSVLTELRPSPPFLAPLRLIGATAFVCAEPALFSGGIFPGRSVAVPSPGRRAAQPLRAKNGFQTRSCLGRTSPEREPGHPWL